MCNEDSFQGMMMENQPAPQKKRYAKYDVSPERFVEVFSTSASAAEAAAKLGMPRGILAARASGYRRRGIKLRHMPRCKRPLNVDALNTLIARLGDEGAKRE